MKVVKAFVALTRDFLIMVLNLFITLISIRRLHHFVLFRDLITKLSHLLQILQIESFYDSPLLFERKILTKVFIKNSYAHQYGLAKRAEEKYLEEGHLKASPTFIEHSMCTIKARAEKFHSRVLILGPEWISAFGHISNLSLFPKAEMLGWLQFSEKIICGGKSANSSMSDLYSEWYTFLKTDPKTQSYLDLCFRDSYQSMNAIPINENEVLDTYSAQFKIEEEFARNFGNDFHLLNPSEDLNLSGKQFLEKAGLDADSWFVTLHMREMHSTSQYRNGDNVDPTTYIDAIKRVLEFGGQVIRIGNSGMTPLSLLGLKHERVLDYAHIEKNDPGLDVFFLSQCKFMIGTGSGPITFPNEFGRPVLYTNTPAIGRTLRLRGVSTPQLLRDRETEKLLNIDEMLSNPLGWNVRETTKRYERVKNTSLDIASAVIDLENIVNENPDNFWKCPNLPASKESAFSEWKIGVPISNSFLCKYGGELTA